MTLHNLLLSRRTIHSFRTDPLPKDALARALQAAHHAPCHHRTWPWRFTQVGPQTRERLFTTAASLKGGEIGLSPEGRELLRHKLMDPPELLVVSQVRAEDPTRAREDYAACACAIHNLCLSLAEQGIGSKWSTGKVTTHPATYAACRIDRTQASIIGFIWIGYPASIPNAPIRPPLADHLQEVP